jgi:hypothetical protein
LRVFDVPSVHQVIRPLKSGGHPADSTEEQVVRLRRAAKEHLE